MTVRTASPLRRRVSISTSSAASTASTNPLSKLIDGYCTPSSRAARRAAAHQRRGLTADRPVLEMNTWTPGPSSPVTAVAADTARVDVVRGRRGQYAVTIAWTPLGLALGALTRRYA